MNRLLIFIAALSCAGFSAASAEEYWIAYEGNDFPENEGWERTFSDPNGVPGQGGAVRTLEDGTLVLDSLASLRIVDFYRWYREVDPALGEVFRMQWRLRVDEVHGYADPGLSVFSDDYRAIGFEFTESSVRSISEGGVPIASFAPYVFHTFEVLSAEMLEYSLFIDGELVHTGPFMPVFQAGRVGWGDVGYGGRSLARWDYFRFGVIPEPGGALTLSCVGLAVLRRCHRIGRVAHPSRSEGWGRDWFRTKREDSAMCGGGY